MNFEYSDEQQQLADSVRKYLANDYGFEQAQGHPAQSASGCSDAVWSTLAEMGVTAIALPEADGGFGGGAVDLMAVMEACGEALVVEPLLDHIGLAARLVARAGSAAQRAALLPGVIDGSLQAGLRLPGAGPPLRAGAAGHAARAAQGDGWVLDGDEVRGHRRALGAPADRLGAHRRRRAPACSSSMRVPAACSMSPCRTVDGQRAADISFAGVNLDADALLGPGRAAPCPSSTRRWTSPPRCCAPKPSARCSTPTTPRSST